MTSLIQCHALVFQTLEDLKAACIEAADGKTQVKDFEVGVFCGQYKTPVPAEYYERSSQLHANQKRESIAVTDEDGKSEAVLIASSGPMNVAASREALYNDDAKDLEHQEDIRYVYPLTINVSKLRWKTNAFKVFTITTLQAGIECHQYHEWYLVGSVHRHYHTPSGRTVVVYSCSHSLRRCS